MNDIKENKYEIKKNESDNTNEYLYVINKAWFNKAYNFIKASKKELVEARYPLPHNSVKHFLLLSTKAENNMWDLQIIDQGEKLEQIFNNPIDFARLIVDTVCSCVDEYDFEYWRYSSEEYERVANIYIQARRAFQEDLFSRFK